MKKILTAAFAFLMMLPLMACGKNNSNTKTLTMDDAVNKIETSITTLVNSFTALDQSNSQAVGDFLNTRFNGGLSANASLSINDKSALKLKVSAVFGENFMELGPEAYLNANVEGKEIDAFIKPTSDTEPSYTYIAIKNNDYNAKVKTYEVMDLFSQQTGGEGDINNPTQPATLATNILTTATNPEMDAVMEMLQAIKTAILLPESGSSAKQINRNNGNYDVEITLNNYFAGGFIAGLMLAQNPDMTQEELMALAQSIGDSIKNLVVGFNFDKENNIQGLYLNTKIETTVANVKQTVDASVGLSFGATIPAMSEALTNAALIDPSNATDSANFKTSFMSVIENTFIGSLIQANV